MAEAELIGRMAMLLATPKTHAVADPEYEAAFIDRMSYYQQRVRDYLSAYLPASDQPPGELHAAMRYATLGDGKHLRPLLTYASGEALHIDTDYLDAFAGAVELIHAFSLVHDDLPAMDDDEVRRGNPTTHVAFGEAVAILAGDALQIAAFHLLSSDKQLSRRPQVQTRAIHMLAQAAGSLGMTGGQAMDIASEGRRPDPGELETMYVKKTGRLIRASIAMPCAWREHADPSGTQKLLRFAERIGLAFQIRDDLLEYISTDAVTGKSTQSDITNQKATYPGLFGVARARHRAEQLYDEAMSCLDCLGHDAEPLRQIASFIVRRKG
ncbi:MAG: polyprenyl synthetase family protein [Woeseia sp.]